MELHVNDLLTRPQIGPLREQELRSNGYVRIRRGVYLPESLLPDNAPRWEIRRLVTQARALSISLTKRTAPPVLSLESALSVRGISAWTNTVDISYRVESHLGQRKPLHLNAVSTRNVDICSVTERPILSDPCHSRAVPVNGVLSAPLDVVALDCARELHPLAAVVAVSAVLAHASKFDRWKQGPCREIEAKARKKINSNVETISGRPGSRQAAAVVNIADAGIQTPGEGYLWWLLHCMLPADIAKGLVTQLPLQVGSATYFPDGALPALKVCFEFDGFGKIKENERDFLIRQRALMSAGWKPIRADQKQLDNPAALISYLLKELHRNDVPAHFPCGTLWKPIPFELLDPQRRY